MPSRRIEFQGERKTLPQWAQRMALPLWVLKKRFRDGWAPDVAIATPMTPGEDLDREHQNFSIPGGGLKALHVNDGSIVVARIYNSRVDHRMVCEVLDQAIRATGKRAIGVVMPEGLDLEEIPPKRARAILEALVAKLDPKGA